MQVKSKDITRFLFIGWRRFLIPYLFAFLFLQPETFAQGGQRTSAWILPGITYQYSPKLKFTAQYGTNLQQKIRVIYLQSFIKTGKHITLNQAYLFLNFFGTGAPLRYEHTLMNAAIFTWRLKNITIDNRSLIWNRFRQNQKDFHFYRNRFRLTRSFVSGTKEIKLYAYDEAWFFINECKWTRNRLAIGVSYDFTRRFNTDITFVREQNRRNGNSNLFFITGTIQLQKKACSKIIKLPTQHEN